MNFQTVAANNGNLVAMFATVAEIGNSKLNVNQKPIQSVTLTDDTGEQHKVTINKGNGQLLDGTALGQRLSFNLSTYQGQQGVCYSGFWNSRAQVKQPAAPTSPQLGTPPPPRGIHKPQPNGEKEMRIMRGNALNAAMSAMQIEKGEEGMYLAAGLQWIMTGRWQLVPEPDEEITNPPPSEDRSDAPY